MRGARLVTPLVILALTGCGFGSLNPLIPDDAAHFDERLLGTWTSSDGESAVITSGDSASYEIDFKDEDGLSGRFDGRMGTIGNHTVLAVIPDKSLLQMSEVYLGLLMPMHNLLVLDSLGTGLRFRGIVADSLQALLRRAPSTVAHVVINDTVVFTATTDALRSFLAEFIERPGVLGGEWMFEKASDPPR
jgi:hypothetical protein